ncbi:hypothetical protein CALVIDRAFT_556957 [Calocera viscosa TUFC12733]|uniref:Uncharacterized protein n=1 Tax=Calocera viscosa (strain TUFC12733) TaxID=1330018 RepID=A0A167JED2_CALVF|nr:hypothetical protein CALVIDRAFT_556957 [Calocera viscosa TUFC12733]
MDSARMLGQPVPPMQTASARADAWAEVVPMNWRIRVGRAAASSSERRLGRVTERMRKVRSAHCFGIAQATITGTERIGHNFARHIVFNDCLDTSDIETARGKIGCEKEVDITIFELLKRSNELVHSVGHRSREEHRLASTWAGRDDLAQFGSETLLKQSIGLVHDQDIWHTSEKMGESRRWLLAESKAAWFHCSAQRRCPVELHSGCYRQKEARQIWDSTI